MCFVSESFSMKGAKLHPNISDFPFISMWPYLSDLSCVSLVYYICNRIIQQMLFLVVPLTSKLERMIKHWSTDKDCDEFKGS